MLRTFFSVPFPESPLADDAVYLNKDEHSKLLNHTL